MCKVIASEGATYLPDGSGQLNGTVTLQPMTPCELMAEGIPPKPFLDPDSIPNIPPPCNATSVVAFGLTIAVSEKQCGPYKVVYVNEKEIITCGGINANLCKGKMSWTVNGAGWSRVGSWADAIPCPNVGLPENLIPEAIFFIMGFSK